MAPLSELDLSIAYRSDADCVLSAFYVPCMKRASLYRRAVGYFTSHGLALAVQGVTHLIHNGGKIHLVASPHLTEDDVAAIENGYRSRSEVLIEAARRSFTEVFDSLVKDRLSALSWLVSVGCLDVKLAVKSSRTGQPVRGIYHEKMGIFSDEEGNHVAFSGSSNESSGGLIDNFESIDVYWSWDDPHHRSQRKIADFERLWGNTTPGLEVVDFTEATAEILRPYKPQSPPHADLAETSTATTGNVRGEVGDGFPRLPSTVCLRPYQEQALKNWFANNGIGTLKMATGSGKTITALAITSKLAGFGKTRHLVVVCPFRHLVIQWARECRRFGMQPILAFESRGQWEEALSTRLYNVESGASPFISVITTNATFATDHFQAQLHRFPNATLLIADEAHNLGAVGLRAKLPTDTRYRLALSATPERWFDDEGSRALFEYFGNTLEPEFTLKDAIAQKALVPYRYYPIFVDLTEEERDQYLNLSEKIAKLWSMSADDDMPSSLKALLIRRSRLVAMAHNKVAALSDLMRNHLEDAHMLFYCGDGTVEEENGEMLRHVEAVAKLLGHEIGFRVATYTAETPLSERGDLLERLDTGELQGLVAIRCLDEGVDLPSIQKAVILASSSNPRQFIQRRGRILRPSPGKSHAVIYDMVVAPPLEGNPLESERSLLRRELERYAEFADLALNAGEARARILPIQRTYGLLDI